jgi:hypothetical protein
MFSIGWKNGGDFSDGLKQGDSRFQIVPIRTRRTEFINNYYRLDDMCHFGIGIFGYLGIHHGGTPVESPSGLQSNIQRGKRRAQRVYFFGPITQRKASYTLGFGRRLVGA